MGDYLKLFENHALYEAYINSDEAILPNVSICIAEEDVHYNPHVRVQGITLDLSDISLQEGSTVTLVATVLPSNASNKKIIWTSSDETIATVNSNGVVTGVSGGVIITATTVEGDLLHNVLQSLKVIML